MKNTILWIVAIALAAGIAAVLHDRPWEARLVAPVVTTPAAVAPTHRQTKEPLVRYPVPGAAAVPAETSVAPPQKPTVFLPTLDESDKAIQRALEGLFGAPRVEALFNLNYLVRRIVVTVDNLPKRRLPLRYLPIGPTIGDFIAKGAGPGDARRYTISAENYRRYTPYVQLVTGVNTRKLVAVYVRFYPLFQKAYQDLGYQYGYFNDRLIEVIDDLLATPEPKGPVELTRPSVFYKFADPHLEALSAGQKILIRIGPVNAARVKAKLRDIRQALTHLGAGHGAAPLARFGDRR
ncbi:MAG: DUF3014 domain-containing protein [Gammaproteobacteria bacterium]